MRTLILVSLVWVWVLCAACGDDDVSAVDAAPGAGDAAVVDAAPQVDADPNRPDAGPARDPLDGAGTAALVQEGFSFLEGPAWDDARGVLLFSDIPANTIFELTPPSTVVSFRNPSGNSNGLVFDTDGLLLAAEHSGRRVSRTMAGGQVVDVAAQFEGEPFNSPNDIAVRSDGTVYFTDPPYGLGGANSDLGFMGIFRVAPGGTVTAEVRGALSARPNGIALSPDERTLYVADTDAGNVTAFPVNTNGSLGTPTVFTTATPGADGMAVDEDGNLYVTMSAGVRVFAPDGTVWGTISIPRQPANCAFGGADGRTLYVTARQGLYEVAMVIPGA